MPVTTLSRVYCLRGSARHASSLIKVRSVIALRCGSPRRLRHQCHMQLLRCLSRALTCVAQWIFSPTKEWCRRSRWTWAVREQTAWSCPALVKHGRRMTAVLSHGMDRRSLASIHLDMLCRMKLVVTPLPPCARMEVVVSFVGFKRGARVACVLGRCARCTCSLA